MDNKTENYVILKPISERFNRIANEITDDEIKYIIKSEIREQVSRINFYSAVAELISEYLEEDGTAEDIIKMYKAELKGKFKTT